MFKSIFLVGLLALLSLSTSVKAQDMIDAEKKALLLLSQKEYSKAVPMLRELFVMAPYDKKYYDNYYLALAETKAFDTAIALCQYMSKIRREDLSISVDLGNVQLLNGDKKAANATFEDAIEKLSPNEFQAQGLAAAFRFHNLNDWEIKTYEAFQKLTNNPYAIAFDLALLYNKNGDSEKAIDLMLNALANQPFGLENTKQAIDGIIAQDPKKVKIADKLLAKRIKDDPQNYLWRELFTRLQSEKGDRSDQLQEIIKLDEQQGQNGMMVLNWSKEQYFKDEWEHALQGLNYILKQPTAVAVKSDAQLLSLQIEQGKLNRTFPVMKTQVESLLKSYQNFFAENSTFKTSALLISYTDVLVLYADQPKEAYDTLKAVLEAGYLSPQNAGIAKLHLGDYQVLLGNVWDAALLYSQVDKTFKEDQLGEEARFRNAKLSYFRGDFEYAQGQLSVLKASTSEFIANDALYLSVLITENTPEDKNFEALAQFSKADLLQFQHKYEQADVLLDSLSKKFPESELQDDILMQRAKIASKEQKFSKALDYLNLIVEKYGEDVLADDALMQMATIYEEQFKDKAKASATYEKLLIDFPGSSFAQDARTRFESLNKKGT